jgi:hypothetical protein
MATKLHSLPPQVEEIKRRGVTSVIPLFDGKKPGYSDWQKIDDTEAKARFWAWDGETRLNFGIRLGRDFGNIVDIDLDSEESRRLWRHFFPPSVSFGRGGNTTHVLYKQVGRDLMDSKRYLWSKRDEKSVVLEVRFSGQTMAVGSVHPESGEEIVWTSDSGVGLAEITPEDLKRRAGMLAAGSMLLRDWAEGWRDEVCVCLAGAMLRAGWDAGGVDHFFESIAEVAGDEESEKRLKAERLQRLLEGGGRVPGLKKLGELISAEMGSRLVEYLELRGGSLLEEMNERHALVMVGGSAYIMDESSGVLMTRESFGLLWANRIVQFRGREVTADKFWLGHENRREYPGGLEFAPEWGGQSEEEWRKKGAYNLWRGWGVSARAGCGSRVDIGGVEVAEEVSEWCRHIYEELCWEDRGVWQWVWGWMQHRVRKPWEPPGTAIVMIGERGDGKGTIASIFGKLFGRHGAQVTQQSQLVGKFNSHLEDKVFVFADEATWGGDKIGEGVLKTMITEDSRVVERKGKDAYVVRNCCGYMIASNYDWVVPVGKWERRFFVSRLKGKRRGDWEYFERLRSSMLGESRGLEVLLWELQRGSGAEWRAGVLPVWGAGSVGGKAASEQWLESASSGEKWIATWLLEWWGVKDGGWVASGGGELLIGRAWQNYVTWCMAMRVSHPMSEVPFAKLLRKVLPVESERVLVAVGVGEGMGGGGKARGREYGLRWKNGYRSVGGEVGVDRTLAYFERGVGVKLRFS